jgi:hypothetical protein
LSRLLISDLKILDYEAFISHNRPANSKTAYEHVLCHLELQKINLPLSIVDIPRMQPTLAIRIKAGIRNDALKPIQNKVLINLVNEWKI